MAWLDCSRDISRVDLNPGIPEEATRDGALGLVFHLPKT